MIKGIGHVAFMVRDMEKMLHFYCDILGMEKVVKLYHDNGDPRLVFIKVGKDQFMELFYGATEDRIEFKRSRVGYYHFCLEVDDIKGIAERLEKNGFPLTVQLKMGAVGNHICYTKDPDGNSVEFTQLEPDSPLSKAKG